MEIELMKEFRFEASHILPKHPGKCSRLHGHSWVLRVYVRGKVDPETGFVLDYAVMKEFVQPIIDNLDHRHLGQGIDPKLTGYLYLIWEEYAPTGMSAAFYPSSENLISWIADELQNQSYVSQGIAVGGFPWVKLELDETCTSRCILTREAYDAGRR